MDHSFIDIHTHSARPGGIYLLNIFAQEVKDIFDPQGPCSVGLHPWHLGETDCSAAQQALEKAVLHPNVLAIGECGLDKNISIPLDKQEEQFVLQLELAERVQKPVIIHCVKAYSEMLHLRKKNKWRMPWLFHWFNASSEIADDLIQTGCYLSFGRSLLQVSGRNAAVFPGVPVDRIFLETDDAEILIADMYERAARLKGITVAELSAKIQSNYQSLFQHG
jgi:TatD DNase family protein